MELSTVFISIALCVSIVELHGAVYFPSENRYPFPRSDRLDATELTNNQSNLKHLPSVYYSSINRRYKRDSSNLDDIAASQVPKLINSASLASTPQLRSSTQLPAMMLENSQQNTGAAFLDIEDQRPIDFDLNLRPLVHFVPGLKSVMDLPSRNATQLLSP